MTFMQYEELDYEPQPIGKCFACDDYIYFGQHYVDHRDDDPFHNDQMWCDQECFDDSTAPNPHADSNYYDEDLGK